MTTIDEFVPYGTNLAVCPYCKEIYSAYDAYFYYNDYYDGFDDVLDPKDGMLEEDYSSRCPNCGESVDAASMKYPAGFKCEKTTPPVRSTGFSLKPGKFSISPPGKFSLAAAGKFSLFSRRKRR